MGMRTKRSMFVGLSSAHEALGSCETKPSACAAEALAVGLDFAGVAGAVATIGVGGAFFEAEQTVAGAGPEADASAVTRGALAAGAACGAVARGPQDTDAVLALGAFGAGACHFGGSAARAFFALAVFAGEAGGTGDGGAPLVALGLGVEFAALDAAILAL